MSVNTKPNSGSWILLATILGSSMVFIDGSVVNVALPTLQQDLHASAINVQWVVQAYSLFLASLILVGGSLGDLYGRKRIFLLGTLVFALSSVWCGFAPSIEQLIIARSVQGIGGALLTPGSLAIIQSSFSPAKRGQAIGLWSGFSSITSALGPVLGGWLVQNASWRWVFFINAPLALVVLLVSTLHVPESRVQSMHVHLDWPGTILITLSLAALVYGLTEANTYGFGSPLILAVLLVGIVALVLFLFVEWRSPAPMVSLNLFRSKTFSGTNLLTFFLYAAIGSIFYFFPFNLQRVQGYSPAIAGAAFLPFTLLLFTLSRWSGGLINRYGAKLPLVVGPLIAVVGLFLFSLPGIGGSYWVTFFPAIIVLGLGMAITIAPLTTTVLGAVEDRFAGVASGINNAVSRVAGLLAIAVFNLLILQAFSSRLVQSLGTLAISPQVRQAMVTQRDKLVGVEIPGGVDAVMRAQLHLVVNEAFVYGFRLVIYCAVALALLGALCSWLLVSTNAPGSKQKNTHSEKLYDTEHKLNEHE